LRVRQGLLASRRGYHFNPYLFKHGASYRLLDGQMLLASLLTVEPEYADWKAYTEDVLWKYFKEAVLPVDFRGRHINAGNPDFGRRSNRFSLSAAASSSIAIAALGAHERNSLSSIHGLHDETCASANLACIVGCVVPENITHWLQELKPVTKNIPVPHHSTDCCDGYRQFDP
jgi:hypothetical protein